jgi:hypothetical protein
MSGSSVLVYLVFISERIKSPCRYQGETFKRHSANARYSDEKMPHGLPDIFGPSLNASEIGGAEQRALAARSNDSHATR